MITIIESYTVFPDFPLLRCLFGFKENATSHNIYNTGKPSYIFLYSQKREKVSWKIPMVNFFT